MLLLSPLLQRTAGLPPSTLAAAALQAFAGACSLAERGSACCSVAALLMVLLLLLL